ncbi:hypothetical protein SAMN05444369_11092 [Capnocytophaga haemolytica]|uniref:Uncharacterized protein n=1 Tax=Capnocytophaga haemolytica TaxID=45243 RepID=A0AAX2GWR0_9FLAO|nr:hypothetical protein SAMN05444369_11092 [Capnocytophaga haemolytica]SNV02310.1 Uncharacterised protein [Capnocytophaga haemolytica]
MINYTDLCMRLAGVVIMLIYVKWIFRWKEKNKNKNK